MADTRRYSASASAGTPRDGAELSELALGRAVGIAVPTVAVLTAILTGVTVGLGPALLVLAAGAIVGTIALMWASVRTLSGDAPIAEGLVDARVDPVLSVGGPAERKRAALRALKDLEFERSVGKIDQEDYEDLVERYRDEAKALMREIDVQIEPFRARAEEIAREHLGKIGVAEADAKVDDDDAGAEDEPQASLDAQAERASSRSASPTPAPSEAETSAAVSARLSCANCSASNDPDATFCKKCGSGLLRACSACQTVNDADADFCKKCGAKLGREANEPVDASA